MNCRKCGAKRITKRRAGVFSCRHCGVQPGYMGLDRFGNEPDRPAINQTADPSYVVGDTSAPRAQPKAGYDYEAH